MNIKHLYRLSGLPVLLVVGASAAAAESTESPPAEEAAGQALYRWIDSNGNVQYGDFQPEGVAAEPVTRPDEDDLPVITSGGTPGEQPDPFESQDSQILPIEHIGPCADARRQLAVLHGDLAVYRTPDGTYRQAWRGDDYRGTRSFLDADARASAIERTRAEVLEHCSDPAAFQAEVEAFRSRIEGGS